MLLDTNDPRLIDYALGECDRDEAREIQTALNDPENEAARAVVREFQQLADAAKDALHEGGDAGLDEKQRESIVEVAKFSARRRSIASWFVPLTALAAMIAIMSTMTIGISSRVRERAIASRTKVVKNEQTLIRADGDVRAREQLEALGYLGSDANAKKDEAAKQAPSPVAGNPAPPAASPAPVAAPPPAAKPALRSGDKAAAKPKEAAPDAAAPSHNLQNVQVGGGLRIRGDWYDSGKANAPASPGQQAQAERRAAPTAPTDPDQFVVGMSTGSTLTPDGLPTDPRILAEIAKQINDASSQKAGSLDENDAKSATDNFKHSPLPTPSVGHPAEPPTDAQLRVAEEHLKDVLSSPNAVAYDAANVSAEKAWKSASDYFKPAPMPAPAPMPEVALRQEVRYQPWGYQGGSESYLPIVENAFANVAQAPLSTFSIDVDTAAYTNVKRFLAQGQLPPRDAVRLEEMINYFHYDLPQPTGPDPFSITVEMADCPWAEGHKLARVALQGKKVDMKERPAGNFVFLIDVSGSMDQPNKLPLVRESMKALLMQLEARDRVAIVTYAGSAAIPLPSTSCEQKATIRNVIDNLNAGGSTNGAQGILDAYRIAKENFIAGGINRVLLATDGDFNVGMTDHNALMQMIADQAKSKVFLTTLGFGYGNLKDSTLEQLADKGNGNYAYINDFAEARKTLVEKMSGTLVTIAKDVKIQVEFNPGHVQAYRLLGYENRALAAKDFNDDTKDAGEIGAGHTVTALYEIVPNGAQIEAGVDALKYTAPAARPEPVEGRGSTSSPRADNPEWMTVKLRYKQPEGDVSKKLEVPWSNPGGDLTQASPGFRFAASVAAFGMVLRDSQYKGRASYDGVIAMADSAKGSDPEKQAFVDLVVTAKTLAK